MIYALIQFLQLLIFMAVLHSHQNIVCAFVNSKSLLLRTHRFAVPDWLTEPQEDVAVPPKPTLISVRFINTVNGKDVTIQVEAGTNLLAVGDSAGVKLPRACRTGLCGSCTCEIQDPAAIATSSNPRDGFATIRACSANCYVPQGMDELVVDVHRMRKGVISGQTTELKTATELLAEKFVDPMARFSGDWEKEFRPQWELKKLTAGAGQVGGASDPKAKAMTCTKCSGSGRTVCYNCDGAGQTRMGDGKNYQCPICVGRLTVGCGYCRGTGQKMK